MTNYKASTHTLIFINHTASKDPEEREYETSRFDALGRESVPV